MRNTNTKSPRLKEIVKKRENQTINEMIDANNGQPAPSEQVLIV